MTTDALDTEVIVVGAGPTGLMLANWLARCGIDVEVVDQKSEPTRESRALAVQARTMEIYDQLGMVEQVLEQAKQGQAVSFGFERRAFGQFAFGDLGRGLTPYPRIYTLEQSRNESLLYALLGRLGGTVHWRRRVTDLAVVSVDGRPAAEVTVVGPDGPRTLRARYCVGADGSSSAVRTLRGIEFSGVTNGRSYFVADAVAVQGLVPDAVNVRTASHDFLLTFPMGPGGHHRLIGIADEDDPGAAEPRVRARLADVFGVRYDEARWFSTYRVHHRIASAFRDGPFFLAGDAAHVHSPVGGQGMNTGLQDAHNLALKLVDVLRHGVDEAYLDRYQSERQPVARRLVTTTDRLFRLVTSEAVVPRNVRRGVIPLLAPVMTRVPAALVRSARVFQYLSQTRIHYWMSASAEQRGRRRDPVVGRRLRWSGDNFEALRSARWQVHSYAGPQPGPEVEAVAEELRGLGIEVHAFAPAPRTGLRPELLYLVRPDGFVAAAAAPAEAGGAFRSALPPGFQGTVSAADPDATAA